MTINLILLPPLADTLGALGAFHHNQFDLIASFNRDTVRLVPFMTINLILWPPLTETLGARGAFHNN